MDRSQTLYKELPPLVEKVMAEYNYRFNTLIPHGFEGIYLTGSVPLGDYHSRKSDIDFITILTEDLTLELINRLRRIHQHIESTFNHPKLNGYYITMKGISKKQNRFPSFFENKMYHERPFELNKVTLFELKNYSLKIYGKPVKDLGIDVEINQVLSQLHENINSYWTAWIKGHSTFGFKYLLLVAFPRLTEWGVLGVARQLYTLQTGKITSKLYAGKYYLDKVPSMYRDVMLTAIKTRSTNKTQLKFSFKRAKDTLAVMGFIIDEFNRQYKLPE